MNLHEAIRHARKELGLSQAALARLAGVPRSRICLLENGSNVTIDTVRRVLRHLPNLQTFTLETATVEVETTRSEPWRQGAVAAAAFLARACQHVIDRATANDGESAAPVLLE